MAVDDKKVVVLIQQALSRHSGGADVNQQVGAAWQDLKARRDQPGGSGDEDLAAAEHYLYARYAVGTGSVSAIQMRGMSRGYEWVKWLAQRSDWLEQKMRSNPDSPTAPASSDIGEWGARGADDGEGDRKLLKRSDPPSYNRQVYTYN